MPQWPWWIQSLLKMSDSGPNAFGFGPWTLFFRLISFIDPYCIHIHIFDCLHCASFMFYVMAKAVTGCVPVYVLSIECEGWTVTCWWWVTYCSTYEHVSNIRTGQGRGCRTAQLLNHLHTFSHQHACGDQDTVVPWELVSVSLLIHTTCRKIISPKKNTS